MEMNASLSAQEVKVIFQPLIILAALDEAGDILIESLNADLELERAGRELTMTSRKVSGKRSGTISKWRNSPG